MSAIQPGWYKDPKDPGKQRWWDGQGWTAHTHSVPLEKGLEPLANKGTPKISEEKIENKPSSQGPSFKVETSSSASGFLGKKTQDNLLFELLAEKQNIALVTVFLALVAASIFFGINAKENRSSAEEWKATAATWEEQSKSLDTKLNASEDEVARLEDRQSQLANEKANAEDQRNMYAELSGKLISVGKLQQLCSDQMTNMAVQISDENWYWVQANIDYIFGNCKRAEQEFKSVLRQVGL